MTRRRDLRFVPLLLALAAGCATLGGGDAQRLRDEADRLLEAQELESAYRKLAEIRTRHPASPEAREVFPVAAAIFQRQWWRHRFTAPDSPWLTTEPGFLFEWLESLSAEEFAQREAESLLLGMPFGFYRDFATFAAGSPVLARHPLETETDNGILIELRPAPGAD